MSEISDLVNALPAASPSSTDATVPAAAQQGAAPDDIKGIVNDAYQNYQEAVKPPGSEPKPETPKKPARGVSGVLAKDDYGTPYARNVAQIESHGDPMAHSPVKGSTAAGLGQFVDPTWVPLIKKHRPDLAQGKSDAEISALKSDPHLNLDMIQALADDNAPELEKAGVPVNDGTLYGAHHFGPGKFAQIYHAPPSTPIENIIGKQTAADNQLSGQTTHQVGNTAVAQPMGLDYLEKDLTLPDMLEAAKQNLSLSGPSFQHTAQGVTNLFTDPEKTLTQLYHLGNGLSAKLNHYLDIKNANPEQDQDEAAVDALGQMYKHKYGSVKGLMNAIANDPYGTALDASTVLSAGGGAMAKVGEIASKLPMIGAAGDAVAGAGRVASTVGANINPLNPGRIISRGIGAVVPNALTKGGQFTPEAEAMVQKRGLKGADMTADQRQTIGDIAARKGVSQAAIDEGIMKSAPGADLQTPTAILTGQAPPAMAKAGVDAAIAGNNEKLGAAAAKLSGGAPSDTDLAEALDNAHTASLNRASGLYNTIRQIPGYFTNMDVPGLMRSAKAKLVGAGIAPDAATAAATGHTQTAAAMRLISGKWGQRQTILPPTSSGPQEVLAMRQALSGMRQAAQGSDAVGVGHIMDALDQTIAKQASGGAFVSPAGAAMNGQDLAKLLKQASSAYRKHFDTFENSDNTIASAVRQLQQARGSVQGPLRPLADPAVYRAAQQGLAKNLLDPVKGAKTYQNLMKATGNDPAVPEFVRSSLLNKDAAGNFAPIKNAQTLLTDPNTSAGLALSPQDLAQARHIHAAHAINNTKLKGGTTSMLKGIMGGIGGTALKGLAGLAGYETLGPLGAVTGPMVEGAMEHAVGKIRTAQALSGAKPTTSRTAKIIRGAVNKPVTQPAVGILHAAQEDDENRPGHAAGGKVDVTVDDLVDGLMKRWHSAKKQTDATTKPLLKVPDAAIVAALKVAGSKL